MERSKIILIGGSAGSFKIAGGIISSLPADFCHSLILCLHRLRNVRHGFLEAISLNSALVIKEPCDNDPIEKGVIYLAPANYHLMIDQRKNFSLSVDEALNYSRPSIDVLFETAAEVFRERCIGIILSGANTDGANGMLKLKEAGATTIIQDPATSEIPLMPQACLNLFTPDYVMSPDKIITYISSL